MKKQEHSLLVSEGGCYAESSILWWAACLEPSHHWLQSSGVSCQPLPLSVPEAMVEITALIPQGPTSILVQWAEPDRRLVHSDLSSVTYIIRYNMTGGDTGGERSLGPEELGAGLVRAVTAIAVVVGGAGLQQQVDRVDVGGAGQCIPATVGSCGWGWAVQYLGSNSRFYGSYNPCWLFSLSLRTIP